MARLSFHVLVTFFAEAAAPSARKANDGKTLVTIDLAEIKHSGRGGQTE
jgi:hypothetical protein